MSESGKAPSAELFRALAAVDPTTLNETELLELIAAWERVRSCVQACQNDAFVAWERLTTPPVDNSLEVAANHRWASDELGLTLNVTGPSAWARVTRAVTLAEKLPQTAAALRAGRISVTHAERAAHTANNVPAAVSRQIDRAVIDPDAEWRTPSQLERAFTAELLRLDPDGAAERAGTARRERGVRLRNEPDGMAALSAFLPADDAQRVHAILDAHARSSLATNTPGDDRTLDQRRADALVSLVCDRDRCDGSEPTVHGRAPRINVTVAWSTLMGLDDLPADLAGYGPVDAATARRIAFDPTSTWRRLIVDPVNGTLLDYGTTVYQPPQDLTDYVIARDCTCRFPGCDQPAVVCDLDHRREWGTPGGVTARHNIDPLCRRHHLLKHRSGWTHERDPDTGDSTWTSPRGQQYRKPATRRPVGEPVEPPMPAQPAQRAQPSPATEPDLDQPPY